MAAVDHEPAALEGHDHGLLQDQDDAELETLSFCDLPLYSEEYEQDQLEEAGSHRVSMPPKIDHEDPFEFSSEDLSASSSTTCPAENIIFCGRLIPFRQDPPPEAGGSHNLKRKKWRFFKGRRSPFRKHKSRLFNFHNAKSGGKRGSENQHQPASPGRLPLEKYRWHLRDRECALFCRFPFSLALFPELSLIGKPDRHVPEECIKDKHGFSTGRFPALSGQAKCRWYVLLFRSARFPVGMELQDMKTRQRRRSLSSKLRSLDIDERAGNGSRGGKGNKNWGLWRLIRALSCSSSLQCGSAAIWKTM